MMKTNEKKERNNDIYSLWKSGYSTRQIGKEYNISSSRVSNIICQERYKEKLAEESNNSLMKLNNREINSIKKVFESINNNFNYNIEFKELKDIEKLNPIIHEIIQKNKNRTFKFFENIMPSIGISTILDINNVCIINNINCDEFNELFLKKQRIFTKADKYREMINNVIYKNE